MTRVYLDVLRWIFEGQEHVTIPAALRRSLSHLKEDYLIFYCCLARARARPPHGQHDGHEFTLPSSSPSRLGAPNERDGEERRKGRRKRRTHFPLLFPPPSIPLHPARHDNEDGDSARRGVARRAADKSRVVGAYLDEGLHGALGYVQERGPTPQISPLIHGGRRVDQKYYYGHLRGDDGGGHGRERWRRQQPQRR